jgi:hypothetical protein
MDFGNKMGNKDRIFLRDIRFSNYVFMQSVCGKGYSISPTPINNLKPEDVLTIIGENTTLDPAQKMQIYKTTFNSKDAELNTTDQWIVPNGTTYLRKGILKETGKELIPSELIFPDKAIHRRFSRLEDKPTSDILKFARMYGQLNPPNFHLRDAEGNLHTLGESLNWWKKEISILNLYLALWDKVVYQDVTLKDMVSWRNKYVEIRYGESRQSLPIDNRWIKGDPYMPTMYYLCRFILPKHLTNSLSPIVLPYKDNEIYFHVDSLLSGIWLTFAWEISGRSKIITCDVCGEWIDTNDPRKKYCSDRCKQMAYRIRKSNES